MTHLTSLQNFWGIKMVILNLVTLYIISQILLGSWKQLLIASQWDCSYFECEGCCKITELSNFHLCNISAFHICNISAFHICNISAFHICIISAFHLCNISASSNQIITVAGCCGWSDEIYCHSLTTTLTLFNYS